MNKEIIPIQTLATATSMNMEEDSELKAIKVVCTRGGSWRRVDSAPKEHYNIEMFWEVIKCLTLEDQRKFLKLVTGCSRGPLLGFKRLEPLFCIQRVASVAREETLNRLPTAATCMNLLKLPSYRSKESM